MSAYMKPGYKQTEVGVIPDDWQCTPSADLATYFGGNAFKSEASVSTGIKWLKIANVGTQRVDWDAASFLPDNYASIFKDYMLCSGDVVMALTRPILGNSLKVAKVTCDDVPALLNQRVAKVIANSRADLDYIYQTLQTRRFVDAMNDAMAGSDPPNIGSKALGKILIACPKDVAEQRAISTALSEVDGLLGALERLIAKKRDLKQAAMQQLLTGQTRLPGFSGPWVVKRLGDVLTICHGRSQRDVQIDNGPYPILATGGQIGTASRFLYEKPSVLIGRKGTIDQPQYMDTPFWTVDTLFYSIIHDNNNAKFLFYRFCLVDWKQYNEASGVPSLNARTIESVIINCPKADEQAAIAAVLSEQDGELAVLEQRREKTRALKQAMMQELLTGRTRLI